jgi:ABC-type transport system involved in multi-copper enzyme maturation permease subunit
VIGQTLALLHDGYRELNSKRMFWIVLVLSGLVVLAFACVGVKDEKLTFLWYETAIPALFERGEMYKVMFSAFGVSIWLGLAASVLALISTASIFPDFISGGSIDLYLSKPIGRLRLFLVKYVTGLLFVALQVFVFSALSYLVIGVRGGTWEPRIFLAVPLVVCFFSYLYGVCVLIGIVTRSTLASVLITVLFWFFLFCLDRGELALLLFTNSARREAASVERRIDFLDKRLDYFDRQSADVRERSQNVIDSFRQQRDELIKQRDSKALRNLTIAHQLAYGLKTALPKTRETTEFMNKSLLSPRTRETGGDAEADDGSQKVDLGSSSWADVKPADVQQLARAMNNRTAAWAIGTSLAFEAVVLMLAAWIFCRRDF